MKKLLSLPPNLVRKDEKGHTVFHQITELLEEDVFCTCDPEGHRIGSGGGAAWLLWKCFEDQQNLSLAPRPLLLAPLLAHS